MVKFCPQCGFKLVQEFKFCPECGFELENIKNIPSAVKQSSVEALNTVEKKICDNCGEENDMDNLVCSGCGAKLIGITTEKVQIKPEKIQEAAAKIVMPKTAGKASTPKNTTTEKKIQPAAKAKSLNKAKTLTIVAVGIGVGVVILIFSGLLNSIIVPGNSAASTPNTNQSSGVDLSSMKKINELESIIKNNPKDESTILELAHLKNDAGMFEQAIINYKQYLSLAPKDADARIDMGICYYSLQNYDAAISEMEEALKYNPKHQIGLLNLGIVNLAAGKMEKSQEWLKKAIEIDPNSEYGKKAQELLSSHNNKSNGGK
jgi:cytochrome c-type biogenesis protein CcmH/NrfG